MKKSKKETTEATYFWDVESVLVIGGILIIGLLGFLPYMVCAWIAEECQKNLNLTKLYIPQILKFVGVIASCLWVAGVVSFGVYILTV